MIEKIKNKLIDFMEIVDSTYDVENQDKILVLETEQLLWKKFLNFIVWSLIFTYAGIVLFGGILSFKDW